MFSLWLIPVGASTSLCVDWLVGICVSLWFATRTIFLMVSADWCGFCTWTAPTPCVVSPGSDCRRMNGVGAFGMCLRGLCWFAQFVTMTQAQVTTCSTCVPASLYDVRADVKPQLEIGRRYEVFSPWARCAWRRPVHALLAVARPRRVPGLACVFVKPYFV